MKDIDTKKETLIRIAKAMGRGKDVNLTNLSASENVDVYLSYLEWAFKESLNKAIIKSKMPKEANDKALDELKKLERMSSHSSEYPTTRTYIEELCKMPWHKKSKISSDLPKAIKILDKDH